MWEKEVNGMKRWKPLAESRRPKDERLWFEFNGQGIGEGNCRGFEIQKQARMGISS